jgi:hypothetical protein
MGVGARGDATLIGLILTFAVFPLYLAAGNETESALRHGGGRRSGGSCGARRVFSTSCCVGTKRRKLGRTAA